MRKLLFVLFLLLFSSLLYAQPVNKADPFREMYEQRMRTPQSFSTPPPGYQSRQLPTNSITITTMEQLELFMKNEIGMQWLKSDPANLEAFLNYVSPGLHSEVRQRVAAFTQTAPTIKPLTTATTTQLTPVGMVHINGGTFTMGSPTNEPERQNWEVQHQVTVSSFYMGKYEVTQKEYMEIMGTNPSRFKGDILPVERVSWYDAIEYCNKRSQKEGLTPAYKIDKTRKDPNNKNDKDDFKWVVIWYRNANGYRLPTSAEWEYACRAGTTTPFSTGNNITTDQANYNGNKPYNNNVKGEYKEKTTPVGSFKANPWGLFDIHGNVSEWCWDWSSSYSAGSQTDPIGATSGSYRVFRTGSWGDSGQFLRSASSYVSNPFNREGIGFRVVRN